MTRPIHLRLPGATVAEVVAVGDDDVRVEGDRVDARFPLLSRARVQATLRDVAGAVELDGEVTWPRLSGWAASVAGLAVATVVVPILLVATGHVVLAALAAVVGVSLTAFWWLGYAIATGNSRDAEVSIIASRLADTLRKRSEDGAG